MFSPANAECTEYVPFDIAITVVPIEGTLTKISSIQISPALNETSNLTVLLGTIDVREYAPDNYPAATNNISTFVLRGTMADMFERHIYYLDTNAQSQHATKFGNVPAEFDAIYKYVAPNVAFVDQYFTVTYEYLVETAGTTDPETGVSTPGTSTTHTATETFDLVVRHNWSSDHVLVKQLIKAGRYYKHAKETGYAP